MEFTCLILGEGLILPPGLLSPAGGHRISKLLLVTPWRLQTTEAAPKPGKGSGELGWAPPSEFDSVHLEQAQRIQVFMKFLIIHAVGQEDNVTKTFFCSGGNLTIS